MKARTDFVTNSSSSSFIIAKKAGVTEKQKEAILDYIIKNFIEAGIAIRTKEELDKYAENHDWYNDGKIDEYYREKYEAILKSIEAGKTVYTDTVSFEFGYDIADLYDKIWSIMKNTDDEDSFEIIDGDLSY